MSGSTPLITPTKNQKYETKAYERTKPIEKSSGISNIKYEKLIETPSPFTPPQTRERNHGCPPKLKPKSLFQCHCKQKK